MEQLTKIVSEINGFLWGMYCLIPLLCGVGIYFTLKLDFIQIRRFGLAVKSTFGGLTLHGERAGKQGMSSFQSLATAIAAQVGTGNLAGAATAIAMGGPGAIFWMWIAAFFGMATIFAEAVLAQTYKTTDDQGHVTGGPAYYISKGLGSKKLAAFFSISIIIALGFIGNMVQSNSIADAFQTAFSLPPLLIGVIISALAAFVFFGGMGRIAAFTEKVVPIMAALYLLGGLIVLLANASHIIPALKMVFVGAFDPAAATGGIIGAGVAARLVDRGAAREHIVFVDRSQYRLDLLAKQGFAGVNSAEPGWQQKLIGLTGMAYCVYGPGSAADYIFDCAGSIDPIAIEPTLLEQAIRLLKFGGTMVLAGVHRRKASLNLQKMVFGLQNMVCGSGATDPEFRIAIDMLYRKVIDFEALVTHSFAHKDAIEAIKFACDTNQCLKVQINYSL